MQNFISHSRVLSFQNILLLRFGAADKKFADRVKMTKEIGKTIGTVKDSPLLLMTCQFFLDT
jgi:hypothetical protein